MGAENQNRPPPLILMDDLSSLADAVEELEAEGWLVRDELVPAQRTWQVGGLRMVCSGVVSRAPDVAATLMAAARGAGVVVAVQPGSALRERLFDDLSRVGSVTLRHARRDPLAGLQPEQRELLQLLANGANLDEAARALSYSRRTVDRRLAAVRATLGARTTAEVLSMLHRHPGRSATSQSR